MAVEFDEAAAVKLGYELVVDGQCGYATKDGELILEVSCDIPHFMLLANIAEREGCPFAAGYGGDQPITTDLIKQVSGEAYEELEVVAAPPVLDAATANLVAAVNAVTSAATFDDAKKNLAALIQQVGEK